MNVQASSPTSWLDSRTFTALDVAIGDVISVAGAACALPFTHEIA